MSASDHDEEPQTPRRYSNTEFTPSSPPPSFRSRTSSPSSRHLLTSEDPIASEAERTLADTFDDGSDSDDDNTNGGDDRQRLMRASTVQSDSTQRVVHDGNRPDLPRTITQFPGAVAPVVSNVPARSHTGVAPVSSLAHSNDGVFANLNAKPERGEKLEEQPPVRLLTYIIRIVLIYLSPMKLLLQMLHPHTGRPPSLLLATLIPPMKYTLMVSPSAPSLALSGTV